LIAERGALFGADSAMRYALERMPEAESSAVCAPELVLEAFNLGVGIGIGGVELAPSATSAAEAEGKILGLAELATNGIVRRHGALKRL
jgi:hypothetical protein